MFHDHRVQATNQIKEENTLSIIFHSALNKGRELVKEKGDLKCWNGEASRLYVRKAQYHWGWDWGTFLHFCFIFRNSPPSKQLLTGLGPRIMTCGPWKPISLEIYKSRISDLHFPVHLSEDLTSATVSYTINLDSAPSDSTVRVALYKPQTKSTGKGLKDKTTLVYSETIPAETTVQGTFTVENPKLWYPYQYGSQPLYELVVELYHEDVLLDTQTKRLAFRQVKLIQRPLNNDHPESESEEGTTFFFEINNIPIFAAGANWIPASIFLTRLTSQNYRSLLTIFLNGGMSLLRIWGGGIYEAETLYDQADELGILLWQDFMFACGQYPANDTGWLNSVKRETETQVRRLKWHPSIVLYAGNNEDYQLAEAEGLGWDPRDRGDPEKWLKGGFPGRYVYEKVLPEVVTKWVPGVGYHPGSPWGGDGANDPKVGDIHQWNGTSSHPSPHLLSFILLPLLAHRSHVFLL